MTLKPEHIVEELNRTPKLKRDLIMKMMEVMLDSEAFLEAYPTLYDGWQSCACLAECSSARWLWCAWVTAWSWQRLPTNGFAGQKRT